MNTVIVIGGDGTVLNTQWYFIGNSIPVFWWFATVFLLGFIKLLMKFSNFSI